MSAINLHRLGADFVNNYEEILEKSMKQLILIISILALFVLLNANADIIQKTFSKTAGNLTEQNSNQQNINPKSYDYFLTPNGNLTIQDAILNCMFIFESTDPQTARNTFKIGLANGNYNESFYIDFVNTTSFASLNITIEGLYPTNQGAHVLGNNWICNSNGVLNCSIRNMTISTGYRGIYSFIGEDSSPSTITYLTVENCTINSMLANGESIYINNCIDGGGIYAEGPAHISNVTVYNNAAYVYYDAANSVYSRGGGIYLLNNTISPAVIENCDIYGNNAIAGGGVYLEGSGPILFLSNKVHANSRSYVNTENPPMTGQTGYAEGVWANHCEQLTVRYNFIYDHVSSSICAPGGIGDALCMINCGSEDPNKIVFIENNTIVDNHATVNVQGCKALCISYPEGIHMVNNNLTYDNRIGIIVNNNGIHENVQVGYCDSYANVSNYLGMNNAVFKHIYQDPPNVSSAYEPIWDADTKSMLIDKGNPDLLDSDGTPSDIGAFPTINHSYESYLMPAGQQKWIKWTCFPVLDRITTANTVTQNFFEPIVDPAILDSIYFKPYASGLHTIYFNAGALQLGQEVANSIQGYKILLKDTVTEQIAINTSGGLQSPTTVLNLEGGGVENWIGYFCKDSSEAIKAIAAIADNVTQIKTQYWCMDRNPDGTWNGLKSEILNYGDFVQLICHDDCSFQWNNNQPVDPKKKRLSKEFAYDEKLDYVPLYIYLGASKSNEIPTEIGLYVNDICKGAVVVEDSLAQLCAYLEDGEEITPENAQLVFYYESKSAPNNMSIYNLNKDSLELVKGLTSYYSVNISDLGSVTNVSPMTLVSQNYPNPFNPSTTISYAIPKDGKVNLAIYNVKGQMVKCLVNRIQAIGNHKIVWDGKNNFGQSCASSVYYYRLNTDDKCVTKKMLLLK